MLWSQPGCAAAAGLQTAELPCCWLQGKTGEMQQFHIWEQHPSKRPHLSPLSAAQAGELFRQQSSVYTNKSFPWLPAFTQSLFPRSSGPGTSPKTAEESFVPLWRWRFLGQSTTTQSRKQRLWVSVEGEMAWVGWFPPPMQPFCWLMC